MSAIAKLLTSGFRVCSVDEMSVSFHCQVLFTSTIKRYIAVFRYYFIAVFVQIIMKILCSTVTIYIAHQNQAGNHRQISKNQQIKSSQQHMSVQLGAKNRSDFQRRQIKFKVTENHNMPMPPIYTIACDHFARGSRPRKVTTLS